MKNVAIFVNFSSSGLNTCRYSVLNMTKNITLNYKGCVSLTGCNFLDRPVSCDEGLLIQNIKDQWVDWQALASKCSLGVGFIRQVKRKDLSIEIYPVSYVQKDGWFQKILSESVCVITIISLKTIPLLFRHVLSLQQGYIIFSIYKPLDHLQPLQIENHISTRYVLLLLVLDHIQ